jgi:hypothetical protein
VVSLLWFGKLTLKNNPLMLSLSKHEFIAPRHARGEEHELVVVRQAHREEQSPHAELVEA